MDHSYDVGYQMEGTMKMPSKGLLFIGALVFNVLLVFGFFFTGLKEIAWWQANLGTAWIVFTFGGMAVFESRQKITLEQVPLPPPPPDSTNDRRAAIAATIARRAEPSTWVRVSRLIAYTRKG